MAEACFKFKEFSVWHDKCAMKVGTDGVLLGAWADVCGAKRILDVGTGTGLVALMLAQRSDAMIYAIEIDSDAAQQAKENAGRSPWSDRVTVVEADFREYVPDKQFDLIVSNPPYFVNSLKSPDASRSMARHSNSLSCYDLIEGVSKLLSADGIFALVIPADLSTLVKQTALQYNLHPCKQLDIRTKPDATIKRTLIAFRFGAQCCCAEEILVELNRHVYSPEYISLTKDFYLKM